VDAMKTYCSSCNKRTNSIRIGRAHVECELCKHDKSLSDVFYSEVARREIMDKKVKRQLKFGDKFFWPIWMEILLKIQDLEVQNSIANNMRTNGKIKKKYVYKAMLAKEVSKTYPQMTFNTQHIWITRLIIMGFIKKSRVGRTITLDLTEKGTILVNHLKSIKESVGVNLHLLQKAEGLE